jgi:hypothetical protein
MYLLTKVSIIYYNHGENSNRYSLQLRGTRSDYPSPAKHSDGQSPARPSPHQWDRARSLRQPTDSHSVRLVTAGIERSTSDAAGPGPQTLL